ncbi:MAG TPA: hypothetical protein VGV61_07615 [Thermoanaerobaculia bacterium]|nr:hypothetical protein [Thermoanaerobaculia bacterium]
MLAVGPAGQVLSGSKASLEQAVRNGCGLRVGFGVDPNHDGKMEIEHWADAMFVSIYHGEVFAQLAPIQEQRAKPGAPAIYFGTSPHPWIGMLDTTGHLAGWFPNEEPSELAVTSWWYVGGC